MRVFPFCTPPLTTKRFQVSYSQTLGVVGYCLLPLVITAPVVSAVQSLPWLAFILKVLYCHIHLPLFFLFSPGFWCFLGHVQWRVLASARRAETQETLTAVPFTLALHLSVLPLQRSLNYITSSLHSGKKKIDSGILVKNECVMRRVYVVMWSHVLFLFGSGNLESVPCLLIPVMACCWAAIESTTCFFCSVAAGFPPSLEGNKKST